MKKFRIYTLAAVLALAGFTAGCDDFLDEMPDNRAEINTKEKVSKMLVSAYPEACEFMMLEFSSDNAMDNGANYAVEEKCQEEAYRWQQITDDSNDSAKDFWEKVYIAIASANQALDAISEIGGEDLQAQKGEALICRAFGHFLLANVFCLPYNPQTASQDMGLPYNTAPETEVKPNYTRGTMAELYQKINDDIEAALPLINDGAYEVPCYHFNTKAAYAFAARFNLYYQKWDKAEKYASLALGNEPQKVLRDWRFMATDPLISGDYQSRCNQYRSPGEPANLLQTIAASSWGYYVGPYNLCKRYGNNYGEIVKKESYRCPQNLWGSYSNLYCAKSCWGMDEKLCMSKIYADFEYKDKVNGVGYRRIAINRFSTNECLLVRAEARLLQGNTQGFVDDMNIWLEASTSNFAQYGPVTAQYITDFYDMLPYMETSKNRQIKKRINPQGFTVSAEQEPLVQCLLHIRRIETVQEGLRWGDIKRYGIEIYHNIDGQEEDVLKVGDLRRALQLPPDVIDAGLTANPR